MQLTLRRVTADDVALLRTVRLAALADAPSAFGSTFAAESDRPDAEWRDRAMAGAEGEMRATWFALDERGEAVGLVGAYREVCGAPEVELVSMWLSRDVRRRGVAQALIAGVIDWARETGATSVRLWVTAGNDPAESLYRRVGFVDTGEQQLLPSDPSKVERRMVLRLDA